MPGNYGVKNNMHEPVLVVGLRQCARQKQAYGTGISFIEPEALTPSWDWFLGKVVFAK